MLLKRTSVISPDFEPSANDRWGANINRWACTDPNSYSAFQTSFCDIYTKKNTFAQQHHINLFGWEGSRDICNLRSLSEVKTNTASVTLFSCTNNLSCHCCRLRSAAWGVTDSDTGKKFIWNTSLIQGPMFHAGPPCNGDHRARTSGDGKPFTRQVKRWKDHLLD